MGAETAKQLSAKAKGQRFDREKVEAQPTEKVNMNGTDDMNRSGNVTVVDTFRLNWWLGGLLGILAGLLTFVMPGITALGLLILIALWAIVTGMMELVAAIRLRKIITNAWLLVLTGVLSIAFGVLLILMPAAGALSLTWGVGIWALVFG